MTKMRVAAATPRVFLADVDRNLEEIVKLAEQAAAGGAKLVVFPARALTGATCGNLLSQRVLAEAEASARGSVERLSARLGVQIALEKTLLPDIIVKCAARPEEVSAHAWRKAHMAAVSAQKHCAYVYANAGYGESTTDGVYGGGSLIYCCGHLLAENPRFQRASSLVFADIDTAMPVAPVPEPAPETAPLDPSPFVPSDPAELAARCEEILHIQTQGLSSRLEAIGCRAAVIGISGGLDSTLAVLVTCLAFDSLGIPRSQIHAVTMPGFGTTDRTHSNATALMQALGVTMREISIVPAVTQHLQDIGHPMDLHNAAYENAQARERTQILMDMANDCGGIVVGTGDLSEIALGWCTYNGDHMSMYGVNGGVPKTLMREIVRHAAAHQFAACAATLTDIVDTPVSPELLPGQKTEDTVGPYELHDYFLYHLVRHGRPPREIRALASEAFRGRYSAEEVDKWLRVFLRRFFSQQFKRSCSPDGPRIGSVSLSPRGAWAMPSDVSSKLWLQDLDR